MSTLSPNRYQRDAVTNALEIFRHAESQLRQASDDASRAAATAHNGCLLLEAPTGSGKTRMAGMIAKDFSDTARGSNAHIVWFWFTPFATLVAQAKEALRSSFTGLRVRDLQTDRQARGSQSGDVFVTTWASVAAANSATRRVRSRSEAALSLDEMISTLREDGFRIGVVVDEAHYGFSKAPEAVRFYCDTLQPDFTLMVTATPDDDDVEKFKKATGVGYLHRIQVSRKEAVEAGLIKDGIRSVAYLAPDDQKPLIDFAATALAEGWRMHSVIKQGLQAAGVKLVPLMLVQVPNSDTAVAEARTRLLALGVAEAKVASYTAKEPTDDLLAVALDETREVLIFKVAVAMGFDAPRAFTLVSMRGAKDTDFGIQVVGRILRVHGRLQGPTLANTLPELLRNGYVFLADSSQQSGLVSAGEKINSIQTGLSQVCPFTFVVNVGGQHEIQVSRDGQGELITRPYAPPAWLPPATAPGQTLPPDWPLLQPTLNGFPSPSADPFTPDPGQPAMPAVAPLTRAPLLRDGQPLVHRTERLPLSTADLLQCIAASIAFDEKVLTAGLRETVKVVRQTVDVFEDREEIETVQARLSDDEIARRAQNVLFDADYLDPRDLHGALLGRLRREFNHLGMSSRVAPAELERALNIIMAAYPNLLRKAARACAAKFKEVVEAAPLPAADNGLMGSKKSRLNVYGVMPQDLNEPEKQFAELLDADTSGSVSYWFRNESDKPWSIGLVMPGGKRYFPDFAIKVPGRSRGDGLLLVETKGKHILNDEGSINKVQAEHKVYGVPLMLAQDENGRFMTVKYLEQSGRIAEDQVFRLENLAGY